MRLKCLQHGGAGAQIGGRIGAARAEYERGSFLFSCGTGLAQTALLAPGLYDFFSGVASFVRPVPLQKTPDGRREGARLLWVFPQLAQQIAFMRKVLLRPRK